MSELDTFEMGDEIQHITLKSRGIIYNKDQTLGKHYWVLFAQEPAPRLMDLSNFVKTGKNYPELKQILNQIKDDPNEPAVQIYEGLRNLFFSEPRKQPISPLRTPSQHKNTIEVSYQEVKDLIEQATAGKLVCELLMDARKEGKDTQFISDLTDLIIKL